MYNHRLKAAVVVTLTLLFLTACSQTPAPSAGDTKTAASGSTGTAGPPVPVSGKTAFWEMYKAAHSWAADLAPLILKSGEIPGIKNDAGKAALWTTTFGSPNLHQARTFSYAIATYAPDIYKGVKMELPVAWEGPTREVMPFDTNDFSVDSDAAYTTALAEAGTWPKRHPSMEVSLTMGTTVRFKGPVWVVLWGSQKAGYVVYVDAGSGAVVKK